VDSNDNRVISKKYHCIKCGKIWGEGEDVHSYGICPECFANYVNDKKIKKGYHTCFGKLDQDPEICNSCRWQKFCKEYYKEHNGSK